MAIVARKARDEYKPGYVSEALVLDVSDCYVQQHQAADCDINNIMARYSPQDIIDSAATARGTYGDFTDLPDYSQALRVVMDAEQSFFDLDAKLRKRFENDPAQFLAFCSDDANRDEMASLGLLRPLEGPSEPAKEPKGDAEPT